ncbi:hypothetical protein H072_5284 [Dactylellina haptotyla CBS 200.50]|uniref:NodB homology domain-containing protein n=1 Tax=Dactylellina haptotyla (strain CBS 200.50) TaxID=1284197 RepID=S8AD02_DACHA|nr:hypothetical protein H072_5284 [Dactylellina haptotyla CBS 200.50]
MCFCLALYFVLLFLSCASAHPYGGLRSPRHNLDLFLHIRAAIPSPDVNLVGVVIVRIIVCLVVAVSRHLEYCPPKQTVYLPVLIADTPTHQKCTSLADKDYTKLINLRRYYLGNVPYGEAIFGCHTTGQIALTFDDGPYEYTTELLDILKAGKAKATFFITGSNLAKGPIDDESLPWANIIRRMYREGHQIAAHSWTHPDLQSLSEIDRRNEMYRLELALSNILGFVPAYMRPPYSSCDGSCLATMKALGYHVIYFDLDTDDYNHVLPDQIYDSVAIATQFIEAANPRTESILSIAHDIHPLTVSNLTVAMLKVIKDNGFETATVGECLGDGSSHWYRKV